MTKRWILARRTELASLSRAVGLLPLMAFVGAGLGNSIAYAQDSVSETDSEESALVISKVVVTARKVEEDLQNTPIAISAFTGADLEVRNTLDITALSGVVPNLSFETGATLSGSSVTPTLFIRGIGQADFVLTADPGVGVYVDGVYVARSVGSLIDLVDIERIEILRGPQGTLFGRNSIGGAISITSKKADDKLAGQLDLTVGELGWKEIKATASVPVSDTLGFRLSGLYREQDGYVDALQYQDESWGREEVFGARAIANWTPSSAISIDISADYSKDASGPAAFYAAAAYPNIGVVPSPPAAPFRPLFNAVVSGDPTCVTDAGQLSNPACYGAASILTGSKFSNNNLYYDRGGNVVLPENETEVYGVSGTLAWEIGNFELKSISGYRGFSASFNNDVDFSQYIVAANLNSVYEQDQFSQEFQLVGSLFDGKVDVVLGAYYFEEEARELIDLLTSVAVANNFPSAPWFLRDDRNASNESKAVFGQLTWHPTDKLHITGGLRYTEDQKDYYTLTAVNPTVAPLNRLEGAQTAEEVTPMISVAYDVTDRLMGYITYSEGFRDGGFPPRITGSPTSVPTYDPEYANVWEAGFKSSLFSDRLRLNAAVFRTEYEDIQVAALRTDLPPGASSIALDNLAAAQLEGAELEANWLITDNLRVDYSLGLLKNKIDSVEGGVLQSGIYTVTKENELPYTPEITSNLGVSYYFDLQSGAQIFLRGDWKTVGDQYLGVENIPEQFQAAYDIVNASATYKFAGGKTELALGVKNATDEEYSSTAVIANDVASVISRNINRPRQIYAALKLRF